ncbi:MAG: peptidase M61 [Thermonemataceae bacterium]|nr:peptidase M61 [Thermonemataceae bacterium]
MKKNITFLFFVILASTVFAQQKNNKYQFKVNLNEIKNDRLVIELVPPKIKQKEVIYHLPKVVPGTYAIHNYGAFASNFQAFDKKGKAITVEQVDKNTWKIKDFGKVEKITYQVEDTWDTPAIKEDIFEPSGTSFQQDTAFVLNNFGLFGYFKGFEKSPYQVNITKPTHFFGATALPTSMENAQGDIFQAFDYYELADSPIMYTKPDTALIKLDDTEVLISIYSPNKKMTAKEIAKSITPVLNAQKAYLGKLPVNKYAFLFYLSDDKNLTRYGALEHAQSSFYYLPEAMPISMLTETIKDVVSHEFFHIVTPLNIHSEEIGSFDYINPKMSKHLWLYEGLTEYAAHHAQVKAGLISLNDFLKKMGEKIATMRKDFKDDLPFTEMSANVLDKYKKEYSNVYQKGAIIGLCLDIKLRELSKGAYGTQDLMSDLSKKYGKYQSFKDDVLFDEIAKLTYPEIRTFFKRYVEGNEPLPLDEILASVDIKYSPTVTRMEINLIEAVFFNYKTKRATFVSSQGEEKITELGKALGFLPTDEIVSINGDFLTLENINKVLRKFGQNTREGDEVKVVVIRKQADGSNKEVILTTKAFKEPTVRNNIWEIFYNKPEAVAIRKAWLGLKD